MSKLLATGWYRLRKDILFWIAVAGCAISGILFIAGPSSNDDIFTLPVYVLEAAFVSLFCGREYSDGTIRNKVICGYSKWQIYLSALLINAFACLAMAAAFVLAYLVLGLTAFPIHSVLTAGDWAFCAVNFVLGCLVYAAMFTLVSMLVPNKSVSVIICLAVMFALYFSSSQLEVRLSQDATMESTWFTGYREVTSEEMEQISAGTLEIPYDTLTTNDGREIHFCRNETTQLEPNPRYLQEPWRSIVETIVRTTPHGQVDMYLVFLPQSMYGADRTPAYDAEQAAVARSFPIYSISCIALFSVLGCLLYRKKALK